MWQNTFTMPALANVWLRVLRPRVAAEIEGARRSTARRRCGKYGSSFGKSTVDPLVIASTCGMNVSFSCRISLRFAGSAP